MTTTDIEPNDAQRILARWKPTPGDEAAIRRCRTVNEVRLIPGFVRFCFSLDESDRQAWYPSLPVVAGVLAELPTVNLVQPVADSAAQPPQGNQAPAPKTSKSAPVGALARAMAGADQANPTARISDPRFRRLLRVGWSDYNQRLITLRRLVRLLGKPDRPELMQGLILIALHWNNRNKQALATHYYQHLKES